MNHSDNVLSQMVELMAANTKRMGALGARAMVLGKFLEAALPHLTTLQRNEITRSFRQGIDDTVSAIDDVALPAEFHSARLGLPTPFSPHWGRNRPGADSRSLAILSCLRIGKLAVPALHYMLWS